jgi:hypothetical protein
MDLKHAIKAEDIQRIREIINNNTNDAAEYILSHDSNKVEKLKSLIKSLPDYINLVFKIFDQVIDIIENSDDIGENSYNSHTVYELFMNVVGDKKYTGESQFLNSVLKNNVDINDNILKLLIKESLILYYATVLYQIALIVGNVRFHSEITIINTDETVDDAYYLTFALHPKLLPLLISDVSVSYEYRCQLLENLFNKLRGFTRFVYPEINLLVTLIKSGKDIGDAKNEYGYNRLDDQYAKYLTAIAIRTGINGDDKSLQGKIVNPYLIPNYIASKILPIPSLNLKYKESILYNLFYYSNIVKLYLSVYVKEYSTYNPLLNRYLDLDKEWEQVKLLETDEEMSIKPFEDKINQELSENLALGSEEVNNAKKSFPLNPEVDKYREILLNTTKNASLRELLSLYNRLGQLYRLPDPMSVSIIDFTTALTAIINELSLNELNEFSSL